MRILLIGDVVGRGGCKAVGRFLPRLIDREQIDLAIVNGENAAAGAGLDPDSVEELRAAGAAVITSGNHIWRRSEILPLLEEDDHLLRPANFPPGSPGRGWIDASTADGSRVVVVNLMGRVFMDPVDCPFQTMERLLPEISASSCVIIVDMHAEATSEKVALAAWLDGQVSAVLGTHTHVQTADEQILPGGTAYITDVGMSGPRYSVIGVKPDLAVRRFRSPLPVRFEVAGGPIIVQGAIVDVAVDSGRATAIRRVQEIVDL